MYSTLYAIIFKVIQKAAGIKVKILIRSCEEETFLGIYFKFLKT